jgi:hypothetical protein
MQSPLEVLLNQVSAIQMDARGSSSMESVHGYVAVIKIYATPVSAVTIVQIVHNRSIRITRLSPVSIHLRLGVL